MNFLAHGIAFLSDPCFVAGTAVPDWLSVADRPTRVRGRLIDRFLDSQPQIGADHSAAVKIASGARQHLRDDDWFHQQVAFIELNAQLGKLFRAALGPDDNFRAGFLGHIVTEMLLDRVLIEQQPDLLEQYYTALGQVDPFEVQATVNQLAARPTERLAPLIPKFIESQFLRDYVNEQKMLFRLNQVMRRVKLPLLPEAIADVLAVSYEHVQRRQTELLPAHVLQALAS